MTFNFGKGGGEWFVNVARGNDISITWDVFDENGDPFDWTGASVAATTGGGGVNWTVGALVAGFLTLTLTDANTNTLGLGTFAQNLTVTKAGDTSTWLAGELKVRHPNEPIVQSRSLRTVRVVQTTMGSIRLAGCVGTAGGGGGGGGAPSGAAGGVLSGSYPNPGFAVDMATQTELNLAIANEVNGRDAAVLVETNARIAADAAEASARNAAILVETNNRIAADAAEVVARNAAIAAAGGGGGGGVSQANVATRLQTGPLTTSVLTLGDIPGLAFGVVAGHRYHVRFFGKFQSAATTTGAELGFSGPAMTSFVSRVAMDQGAAGVSHLYTNSSLAPATIIGSAAVAVANTDVAWSIEATFQPSASGTLQLRGASEVNGSAVTFQNVGIGILTDANADGTPVPPTGTARISEDFGASFEGQPASTDTTSATSMTGSGSLTHDSGGPPDGSALSLHCYGTQAHTLRWDLATVTLDKGIFYYKHGSHPSETAWIMQEYAANGTTVAWRLGVTSVGAFVLQNPTAGTATTANFTNVIGKNYRFQPTVTGSGTVSIPIFNEAAINAAQNSTPTDILLLSLTAVSVSDIEIGLINTLTGGGSTIPANLTDEPFNGPNGVQITAANTTADRHYGSGSITFNTGWAKEGTSSMRVNGTTRDVVEFDAPSHARHRASFYLKFTSAPGTNKSFFCTVLAGDNASIAFETGVDIAGKMFTRQDSLAGNDLSTMATAFSAATEYRGEVDATGSGAVVQRLWRGATLDSAVNADAWQTATMTNPSWIANFGREILGQSAPVAAAPDYSIDRWKSSNSGMPSPVGTGTGAGFEYWLEHMWWDSATTPPNVFIDIAPAGGGGGGGGGGGTGIVSQKLVPPDGTAWWGATTGNATGQSESSSSGKALWVSNFGRYPDILGFYRTNSFSGPTSSDIAMMQPSGQPRSIGLYHWKIDTTLTLLQVAQGGADNRLLTFCNAIKGYPYHIFLALYHEQDNNNNETSPGQSYANYVSMWQHCVDYIRGQGVKNVVFVWNQTGYSGQVGSNGANYDAMYPGDAYVDWIAQDPYWDTTSASRDDFAELVNENFAGVWTGFYNWAATNHPTKPQMLAEWSPDFSTLNDGQAASRLNTVPSQAANYPKLKAYVQWNSDKSGGIDGRIQGNASSVAAFSAIGVLARFNVGTANCPVPA